MEKACKFWLIVPLTYVLTYHPSGKAPQQLL
jgi:hypothetical protein